MRKPKVLYYIALDPEMCDDGDDFVVLVNRKEALKQLVALEEEGEWMDAKKPKMFTYALKED